MSQTRVEDTATLPLGTVTFMFTDIEGSSKLWQENPEAARVALGLHDDLIVSGVTSAGGHVVKSRGEGDSHFAVFADAAGAVAAAAAVQRALFTQTWPTARPVRVRMALHSGVAELRMGDYFGTAVNRCARIRAAGHGGQILLSQSTAELVRDRLPEGVSLQDLGRHHLRDLERSEQIFQVTIDDLPAQFPPLKSHNAELNNLPASSTSFVGRAEEVEDIARLLQRDNVRLVTLTGPGGTGKTRLSLQIGQAMLGRFADGIFFIPLAEATSAELVVLKTGRELALRQSGGEPPFNTLQSYLQDKEILLILDNFEQIVDAAGIVAELLAAAPGLKFLITSRILLNIRAENSYPVPSLTLPRTEQGITLEALDDYGATSLFLHRARSSNPRLILAEKDAATVAEICRKLDGLPLAIELAAARTRLLSLEALLSRLSARLQVLTGGARDLPARHQTLRSAIEWSYDLLGQPERLLLARLSVFAGGFFLEAAEAVCTVDDEIDVLGGLELLLDHSLLRQETLADGTLRFFMLEAIREYAQEQLRAGPDLALVQERHATYFAAKLLERSYGYYTPHAEQVMTWNDIELDNLRTMMASLLESVENRQIAADVVLSMQWYWFRRGYVSEGRSWSERVLRVFEYSDDPDDSTARSKALAAACGMAMWQGDLAAALPMAERAVAEASLLEDPMTLSFALFANSVVYLNMGQEKKALGLMSLAMDIYRELNIEFFVAAGKVHLAGALLGLGDFDGASDELSGALQIGRRIGEPWLISFAINNQGEVARAQGRYEEALIHYLESEKLLREMGDVGDLARLVHTLGYIALHEDDSETAEQRFRESLSIFLRVGNQRGIAECLAGFAALFSRSGRVHDAAVLLAAASALQNRSAAAWWPADRDEITGTGQRIETLLDHDELTAAAAQGTTMALDEVVALALGS